MAHPNPHMRIQVSEERRQAILDSLLRFYGEAFDEEISRYRAERLLEFFIHALGPPVYNQAIQDARAFMQEKLDDLDAEFYDLGDSGGSGAGRE